MSDLIAGALIGAGATALGGVLTFFAGSLTRMSDAKKLKSEEARWVGQFVLQRRFDALAALHERLVACRFDFIFARPTELSGESGLRQSIELAEAFDDDLRKKQIQMMKAGLMAALYLSPAQETTIASAVKEFHDVTNLVLARLSHHLERLKSNQASSFLTMEPAEHERLSNGLSPAMATLKELLSPPLLLKQLTDTSTDT